MPVIHVTKRCVRKACRRTHCYNYRWQSGSKYNNVDLCEIDVLFVTSKLAFEKRFLQYHCSLQFRGFVSARAIAWACRDSLLGSGLPRHWHVNYEDARFLFTAMSELEDMRNSGGKDFTRNIQLTNNGGGRGYGMEMTDTMLSAYSAYLHDNIFPTPMHSRVRELVGDGHEKILTKICAGDTIPRKGPISVRGKRKRFSNGWFMLAHPCGRIVAVEQQFEPENNEVVTRALQKVERSFPMLDCFIMDRNCKYAPLYKSKFAKIKTWAIDKFHAKKGHGPKCKCSPYNHRAIMRRLKGINTSVCEQVWSWLRNYASTMNHMSNRRHKFLLFSYVRRHNDMIAAGDVLHLNPFKATSSVCKRVSKRPTSPGHCAAKRIVGACLKAPAPAG